MECRNNTIFVWFLIAIASKLQGRHFLKATAGPGIRSPPQAVMLWSFGELSEGHEINDSLFPLLKG